VYIDDHPPPHFHAEYGEFEVLITINTLALVSGNLPPRVLGLVIEWAALHQDELNRLWDRARNQEPLSKIAPLK
jgi:hypothetical protein